MKNRKIHTKYIICTAALRAPVRRVAHPHSPLGKGNNENNGDGSI